MTEAQTYQRHSASELAAAVQDSPAVLIHGPRQCGKTTLAQQFANQAGYSVITFDDDNQRAAASADPQGFVAQLDGPVVLDEIQRVPGLFTSLKAAIDNNRVPGRFILTGSANVLLLPQLADSLAGRMEIIRLRPLAFTELAGQPPAMPGCLFDPAQLAKLPAAGQRLGHNLAELICAGSYPAALQRKTAGRRQRWYRDYITTITQRDIQDIARIHQLAAIPSLLAAAAEHSARLFNASELAAPFALSRPTVSEYLGLLEQIFLIEQLPAWHGNRLNRLIKTPKMHIADTGLACALLGVSPGDLAQDRALLGRLLETFVYQELRKQADNHPQPIECFHFRNKDKVEVDIVLKRGQRLAGIEVKAASTVTAADFKGLKKLQSAWPEQFSSGVVFYDGDARLPFGPGLWAIPISQLIHWPQTAATVGLKPDLQPQGR